MANRTILITGASDGLGKALALRAAAAGDVVLLHGRSAERIDPVAEEIRQATGNQRIRTYTADLSRLDEVRRLAEDVLANEPRLDVLVNNAGIGNTNPDGTRDRRESPDGIELRFAVNYLADYLLTRLLLPRLKESAPARIVHVSSAGQSAIDFDDPMLEKDYRGGRAYTQSKLAQILFTIDLAKELEGSGVTVNALHPSTYMPTKIVTSNPLSTIEQGVEATWRLVADPALEGVTGRYFDVLDEARADPQAYDPDARRRLRELSERLFAAG
ncbi:MAG TPA: SDR family NAD(P)-dependent oxidoreductase [Frankiaceae bacterium]|nr:SDR family NAD(P)-dependent oxidoreductase [Frankiaceae bacterium]